MKINYNLDSVLRCPSYSLSEVWDLSLDVWFATRDIVCPVTNRNADMIKPVDDQPVVCITWAISPYPAAAIAWKSASVIHVFQWFVRVLRAEAGSWNSPNVYSSTMRESPVSSNSEGVIQGYKESVVAGKSRRGKWSPTSRTNHPPRLTPRIFSDP